MTNETSEHNELDERIVELQARLDEVSVDDDCLRALAEDFSSLADAASLVDLFAVSRGAEMFSRLLELAACWSTQFSDDPQMVNELIEFVRQNLPTLRSATDSDSNSETIDALVVLAQDQWSEYLSLLEGEVPVAEDWDTVEQESDVENGDVAESQIELLLSALSESESVGDAQTDEATIDVAPSDFVEAGSSDADQAAKTELANDRELLEAYLDDAMRCLSSMEMAALESEQSTDNKDPISQFCRELHTLKGASASVGLSGLAAYLHELESSLQAVFDGKSTEFKAESLFDAVDRVRAEIESLNADPASEPTEGQPAADQEPVKQKSEFSSFAAGDDSSIRIRAAKLDRLMDMLAELVVLRNRRESHVAEFNVFNEELARCAGRLSFADEQSQYDFTVDVVNANPFVRNGSCTFTEVAKDITAVSNGMRELQKPVSLDNAAISRFIRDFRQELMQLRRVPVSGLFHRLQRAARDAAKSEDKQVQIEFVGEHAGLEQEIQDSLYESLLHVVRNSVSHGIESKQNREKAGKGPVGTITLEASSSTQLLMIDVHDDGNGIDHAAVRKRAVEKGLLSSSQQPSNSELAKLIFHPGFSTRTQASAVSGRGVGMDIVAKTIEQLHGRIDIESVAGQGTTIRLSIPLRTGIEHVMVFRTGGQLFALPMQSVTAAKASNANIGEIAKLSLSTAFNRNVKNSHGTEDVLLLRQSDSQHDSEAGESAKKSQIALAVDELIGPEEVVVRGLPNLLKHHPLFCGVTLSGSGEKVLLLDSQRVMEYSDEYRSDDAAGENSSYQDNEELSTNCKRALVVDDSLTARRVLVKILQKHGFVTVEAGDGIEAIERLHRGGFDLVFTDLDMPRFGGLELLSDIQTGNYCDAPVVVVSSRNEELFQSKAMDVGASDFVTKPVSELSITQLLENLQLLPEFSKG